MIEDEMVGWHLRLNGHEFEQAPGVGDGQGGLACCSPWGHKALEMTEQLNSNNSSSSSIQILAGAGSLPRPERSEEAGSDRGGKPREVAPSTSRRAFSALVSAGLLLGYGDLKQGGKLAERAGRSLSQSLCPLEAAVPSGGPSWLQLLPGGPPLPHSAGAWDLSQRWSHCSSSLHPSPLQLFSHF